MSSNNKRVPIKDLSCACVDVKPRTVDWGEVPYDGEGDEGWSAWSAEECEECHKLVVLASGAGGDKHRTFEHEDGEPWCNGYVHLFEGPAMNYFYPLCDARDLDSEPAAIAIAGLPLCIVRLNGEYGLALTGGGMDLSWEIARAFIALGYLPPTHFDLPAMAGKGTSDDDKYVIAAYRRACMVQMGWLRQRMHAARALGRPHEAPPPSKTKTDRRRGFKPRRRSA